MTAEEAFDRYHQAVFGFVYRLMRRADMAEDITQECFLAFVRAPDRFDAGRGTVKTFLFAIARNLALKHYRDSGRIAQWDDAAPPPASDPRSGMEVAAAVATAIATLPVLQQEALILFEYEGFTLQEIAEVAGTDTGTVKSRLHRARARLKRDLAPYRALGGLHGTVRT